MSACNVYDIHIVLLCHDCIIWLGEVHTYNVNWQYTTLINTTLNDACWSTMETAPSTYQIRQFFQAFSHLFANFISSHRKSWTKLPFINPVKSCLLQHSWNLKMNITLRKLILHYLQLWALSKMSFINTKNYFLKHKSKQEHGSYWSNFYCSYMGLVKFINDSLGY